MATDSVVWSGPRNSAGAIQSPQIQVNEIRNDVSSAGRDSGRKIRRKMRPYPHPTMIAATSSS